MKSLMQVALNEAVSGGASYSDVRFTRNRSQYLVARGSQLIGMRDTSEEGLAVRVFLDGAWGFAAAQVKTPEDAARLARRSIDIARSSASVSTLKLTLAGGSAHRLQWVSDCRKNPFDVPLAEKTSLLLEINRRLAAIQGIADTFSVMHFWSMQKVFIDSLGSEIDQHQTWGECNYSATAIGTDRFVAREFQSSPRQMGYELIDSLPLLQDVPRVGSEALELLKAKSPEMDRADLILLPSHTRLVIHETIGHATELDRILGWEADYAGTSFATPEKLNHYQYGSPIFNVTADRTQLHGMATCAFDDDGVPTTSWPIVKNGVLTGYSMTRDTAPFIGVQESNGCSFADGWYSMPILRMANVCIDPGPDTAPTLDELISDTRDGILIDGMGSFSIDHQRINFQFGCDYSRRIRNGRIEEPLYNVTYEGSNPGFWSSVDAICRPSEWVPFGLYGCAKGQPVQTATLTHGSAPMRLRNIKLRRNGQ